MRVVGAARQPRVSIGARWTSNSADSGFSIQVFGKDVARNPRGREMRHMWFSSGKYFQSAPRYGYQHKWMPTIAPSGQDVEVDPFNRISKRGLYQDMLRNWQPWYRMHNLLRAKGAPASAYQIAADLNRVSGLVLSAGSSGALLRCALRAVESALYMRLPGLVSRRHQDAEMLVREIRKHHTFGLPAATHAATLLGLRGRWEEAEALVEEMRPLLDDPETPLRQSRDFVQAVGLACASALRLDRAFVWLGEMNRRQLRATKRGWKELLNHCASQKDTVRLLEVWKNMDEVCEKSNEHYQAYVEGVSQAGRPDLVLECQLEMRRNRSPLAGRRQVYDMLVAAYANAGDMDGGVRIWDKLLTTRISRHGKKRHRVRRQKLGAMYTPGFAAVEGMMRGWVTTGRAAEGYLWFKQHALIPAPDLASIRLKMEGNDSSQRRNVTGEALQFLMQGLLQQGHPALAAEMFDEVRTRREIPGASLINPRLSGKRPYHGGYYRVASAVFAAVGRLAESHHCLVKMFQVGRPADSSSRDFLPLLRACAQEPGGAPLILNACLLLAKKYNVQWCADTSGQLLLGRVALGDVAGATAEAVQLRRVGEQLPADCAAALISAAPAAEDGQTLCQAVWLNRASALLPSTSGAAEEQPANPTPNREVAAAVAQRLSGQLAEVGGGEASRVCLRKAVQLFPGLDEALAQPGFASRHAALSVAEESSWASFFAGQRVYVADATAALHLRCVPLSPPPTVVILPGVVTQLQSVLASGEASGKDRQFAEDSLAALQKAHSPSKRRSQRRTVYLRCTEELRLLAEREAAAAAGPVRVMAAASALCQAGIDCCVLTNDAELAAVATARHGLQVHVPVRASAAAADGLAAAMRGESLAIAA